MNVIRSITLILSVLALLCYATYGTAGEKVRDNSAGENVSPRAGAVSLKLPKTTAIPAVGDRTSAALTGMTMNWSAVTGGGFTGGTSNQFGLSAAAGQTVVGEGGNPEFDIGIGFYHGAQTCFCGLVGDLDGNRVYDSLDLNILIVSLFFGGAIPHDPTCPTPRTDFNCDSVSDNLDLNEMILFLFFGGPNPCNACNGQPL
ncbi:MAG: hypothetical protein Kow0074_04440 [Candidatus Zixiibacteriota bacterium]